MSKKLWELFLELLRLIEVLFDGIDEIEILNKIFNDQQVYEVINKLFLNELNLKNPVKPLKETLRY